MERLRVDCCTNFFKLFKITGFVSASANNKRNKALLNFLIYPGVIISALIITACGPLEDPIYEHAPSLVGEALPPKPTIEPRDTRHLLWGDLHIHTSLSYDAYVMGARVLPEDAYNFAKGKVIDHALGYPVQISAPLDFAAVTDHAEYLGVARAIELNGGRDERQLEELHRNGSTLAYTWHYMKTLITKMADREKREELVGLKEQRPYSLAAWQQVMAAADQHNEPGRFTAFVGFEWSSLVNGENLHRNVIYKSSLAPDFPFSARESKDPYDLWSALDGERESLGLDVIAIPHNGNVSNGKMYGDLDFNGKPFDDRYAEMRLRNEPISEIFQIKGSSESHPMLSPDDEFANFELFDQRLRAGGGLNEPRGGYTREALKTGIKMAQQDRVNPYRIGVIGSSDSHNGTTPVEEHKAHGKLPMLDGSPTIRLRNRLLVPDGMARGSDWSAQGLAAVWAKANTRESIFEALRSRETYATSGPRIAVRFFAGWQYPENLLQQSDMLDVAYRGGVPMGGELLAGGNRQSPVFVVWADKDSMGANLDRIQIIKGWVDTSGQSHEHIYNVAASDGRVPGPKGQLRAVGNTVDIDRASYENSIGNESLSTLWTDPDFDPSQHAFYYARVIEIPTPRWSSYDAALLQQPVQAPAYLQERAVTSAIWYVPVDAD